MTPDTKLAPFGVPGPTAGYQSLDLHDRVIPNILATRAADNSDHFFLHVDDQTLTYAEMHQAATQAAKALVALGVERNERVVLMLPNGLPFLVSWFGTTQLGATVVPINPDWKGETLAYILGDADPSIVIVDSSLLDRIKPLLPELSALRAVLVCEGSSHIHAGLTSESAGTGASTSVGSPPILDWSNVSQLGADVELGPPPVHDDIAAVLYSSGTTGRPKGIMLQHAHVYSFGEAWISTCNLRPDDILYSPLPLFYMQPMLLGVIPTLMVGAQVHVVPQFSASRYWADIRDTRATIAHSQFTLIPFLLRQPPSPLDRQHQCTRLFIGKSNEVFEERFGVRLIEIYGSTESNLVTYNPWDAPRAGSVGMASPAFEVRIVDSDDRELPQGETGEIVFRPREPLAISAGYLNNPTATLSAWRNMWFHLGDLGYVDEDGYFFFVGRKKDVIRRKGENISAVEVERQINSHPSVSLSAAIPIPDEMAEEEVKVFVVLEPDETLQHQELIDYLRDRMPKFMLPRYIEFTPALPMTPSMKIQKVTLLEIGLTPATWDRASAESGGS